MTQANRDDTKAKTTGRTRYALALLPLLLFGGFALIAGKMLYDQDVNGLDISAIPSALIGTKAPALSLPPLEGSNLPALTDAAIKGKLTLVNVFASWCIPCRQEHPLLQELAKDDRITVVGINYKDKQDNALRFLGELGNPFAAIGVDPNGKAAIDWGVYGIPESYLVGADGTILYKKVGPFDARSVERDLLPAIAAAAGK
ncbi:DsbE family thiol:disulfide interchange protein [Agrobacterium radiobacter]|jgi:cytochrome c biogenesis protein CcmG/thiol:disulfide interchange protein DsbE|uniref:DsbE family thiol:disulfide interchange protein n=2 Tax=Agrobacterium tumefaciens TaxID=358 RepID=A0AAP9E4R3_AGRTU|nr:DsbE family thiol:disulfide interchange protein [Agrobacterium tumefaciens]AYM06587.1 cytochrome c biogenesis protein CcmG, thiol:disulfide interchange protein DsbE [Agrobacterium tumefaciens]KWT82292.1 thiol:disulfide interchange protein [Agrobacterium tumefaciens str. B6]MQB25581.1 DsbE family thiol:disulfide interchange protein [Agrobacterium tumefaciens]NSZ33601.1 DsbE family thiol:disulfide interchange protein [Agrobacterium tumefaciens]NSZ58830.1 DsbE family thiol:disulfide interchang